MLTMSKFDVQLMFNFQKGNKMTDIMENTQETRAEFLPGQLGYVSGRPASGKSTFLVKQAIEYAVQDLDVLFISLELSKENIMAKIASMHPDSLPNLYVKRMKLGTSVAEIFNCMEEYEADTDCNVGVIIVDSLELLAADQNDVLLKKLAMDRQCAVLTAVTTDSHEVCIEWKN
jgi:predicted ATP-dependent serine protease